MKDAWVEMRLWRQFVAVAQELHFGRAAARLHMTQPPLTQAIAGLERALGVPLFDRTRRSVCLTPAGTALLPEVLDLLARAQALPERARAAAAGEVGRLRLAFVSTVGFDLLPRWVRRFRERFPGVTLDLMEATGDVQLEMFRQGQIDAGLMLHSPGLAPEGFARSSLAVEPLVVALPEAHPLAAGPTPDVLALLAEPLVIFPRRILPSLYDALLGLYHQAGTSPRIAQEAIQMQTIVNLVSAGMGLAWVPQSVRQFQRSGVVYRSVAHTPALPVPVCETSLLWPQEAFTPALRQFIEFLESGEEGHSG